MSIHTTLYEKYGIEITYITLYEKYSIEITYGR